MNVKFINYTPASTEEKHMGIATITLDDKLILKYKVIAAKDGKSFFITAPSYKDGEAWYKWFQFDSNLLNESIENTIRTNVNAILNKKVQTNQTVEPQQQSFNQGFGECPF